MNKTIETHFTDKELNCGCGCGKTVAPVFLLFLEALRYGVGSPLPITSGARCELHNRIEGGADGSIHLLGLAGDIRCTDSTLRFKIISEAVKLGARGIGINFKKHFIHIDLRVSKLVFFEY